jgi:hypothetical protein
MHYVYKLLKYIFFDATGKDIELNYRYENFTKDTCLQSYKTKAELVSAINCIKQHLIERSLTQVSNIDSLNTKEIIDNSSRDYPLLCDFINLMSDKYFGNLDFFQYKNIISLADGISFFKGSVNSIIKVFANTDKKIKFTATDISYSKTASNLNLVNKNITVKIVNLDNTQNFLKQDITEKFDLILMKSGLCCCNYRTAQSLSCGGIKVYDSEGKSLKNFLVNVSSILDTDKPYSKAVLTSRIYHEPQFLEDQIQEFNNENTEFIAEIIRNCVGTFSGIIIHLKPMPDKAQDECFVPSDS